MISGAVAIDVIIPYDSIIGRLQLVENKQPRLFGYVAAWMHKGQQVMRGVGIDKGLRVSDTPPARRAGRDIQQTSQHGILQRRVFRYIDIIINGAAKFLPTRATKVVFD